MCDEFQQGSDPCSDEIGYLLVTERPSNRAEIVAVMEACTVHKPHELGDPMVAWSNYMWVPVGAIEDYIETPAARANGHLWSTL